MRATICFIIVLLISLSLRAQPELCIDCKCPCKPALGADCTTSEDQHVFFSYANEDYKVINLIESGVIKKQKISYWAYLRSCLPGTPPDDKNLKDLLNRSRLLIFVVTDNWKSSPLCQKEYNFYIADSSYIKTTGIGSLRHSVKVKTEAELHYQIGEIFKNVKSAKFDRFVIFYKPTSEK
jgi:hypothetical protein